jgi:hypothetical protein
MMIDSLEKGAPRAGKGRNGPQILLAFERRVSASGTIWLLPSKVI